MENQVGSDEKQLADEVWESWGQLYGNGVYCEESTVRKAIQAYDSLGFEGFRKARPAVKYRHEEVIANLICQGERYGIQPSVKSPEIVRRMVNALHKANIQWTTGGIVGNVILGAMFWVFSSDYRWFVGLER